MRRLLLLLLVLFSTSFYAQKKKKDTLPIPKWKINGKFGFVFNQSSFSNWVSGGENMIAGDINVNYDFNYKKNNVNWDTRILTAYGLSHLNTKGYRKTNDRFELNSLLGIKSGNNWFLSQFVNFKTQYSRGYNYKVEPAVPVSDFFSPAYLSLGPGMLWKKSDNSNINIAPATARLTMVSDLFSGQFGVEEGDNTNFSLGFNLSGYFKFTIMENVEMENIVALYSDYLDQPDNLDLENQTNIRFKVNNNIKMHMTFHAIVDDNASSKVQFRQLFGLGLNYKFHQKVTY
ncbi:MULTISPECIES: DUF3078 domain-containing protein [unclassified Polaribacter]|jgi:hypothetical protein|uniref:DUF3078 domain-containing protein n=1 Tax=unclassified Polaribacter TaxID=196858 RepID=UPI001C4F0810|nr:MULTISPECIES: DUF3078 domain-containing protein [unclassified Polaribacter]QXP64417.1 DUF3078 domain-containing protein [Polaribacter sp. HaHaR_3_91]QXP66906.1 DUF3078 domain-containing protein [Polaribacter sp. AHE13PA]QXP69019.1 DUF3078 domain-containing protein [Polaribacter sp. R2A056_3_33]